MLREMGGNASSVGANTGEWAPLHAQQDVTAYLESIANETAVFQMFSRLVPYFHGKHHVEEIMWRETVSRKAINSVLATYSSVLVRVLHSESAPASWSTS